MTRQEVINELKDICAVIDEDGELVAEDSLDALASRLMEEGSEDISEKELDAINEMIYASFVDPETICNELVNMLMSSGAKVEDVEDPLTADMWDDLTDDEIAALTADGPNYAEFSDHHYQEGCEGGECKEGCEGKECKEAYYGKDSLIAGDIPGKENCFHELISMRFHNMGYDEDTYPLMPGSQSQMWNPFGQYGIVMYGPDAAFFDKIVAYIETEVNREDSAWYNRDYEVCQVEGREATDKGPWALCIECMPYDMDDVDLLPRKVKDEYARRRKMRRNSKPTV
jgi:hypothetical protein